ELSVKNENFIFVKDDLKFELSDIDLDENELDSEKIIFGIRPEHLYEVETNEKFAGEILSIEPLGREILIVIETTIGRLHYLFSHENEKEFVNKKIGDKVKLDFESTNVNLFDSTTKESILN
ncbi:MAG: TOBE domain-containing protein, partial [Halanaerobium sp. MSAO_Bac5]